MLVKKNDKVIDSDYKGPIIAIGKDVRVNGRDYKVKSYLVPPNKDGKNIKVMEVE